MSYKKQTLITTKSGRTFFRAGHAKTLAKLPEDATSLTYFVVDMSGKGRGGNASIMINRNTFAGPTTTDKDLSVCASKA